MINIMLVDDHKMIREGLKSFLETNEEINVVAEAGDGVEALKILKARQEDPVDVLVTDIAMPNMDGISLVKEIKREYPDQKVMAMTMMNESQYVKQMLAAGANGYVLKNCTEEEFIKAIKAINSGSSYYSQEVTSLIMESLVTKKPKQRLVFEVPLSEREKEVLHLICKEMGNHEIAEKLFISVRTVEAHKRNLLEKTGCKNVAGLVVYAIEKRLFEDV